MNMTLGRGTWVGLSCGSRSGVMSIGLTAPACSKIAGLLLAPRTPQRWSYLKKMVDEGLITEVRLKDVPTTTSDGRLDAKKQKMSRSPPEIHSASNEEHSTPDLEEDSHERKF